MSAEESWAGDTWVTGPRIGEIESLAVLPGHRGRGLGGELLDGLERSLADQGVGDLVLGLLPGNAGAARLYERRGYRAFGAKAGYYEDGCDAVRYEKALSPSRP